MPEKVDVQILTELLHKGARIAKETGILKECGKMCHNCAFKENQPQQNNYLMAITGATWQLMTEGEFNCHTKDHEDAGTECVGFKLAKIAVANKVKINTK